MSFNALLLYFQEDRAIGDGDEEYGLFQEVLYGYPYLKHIIQLWPGDLVDQMEKVNEEVVEKNRLGGRNIQIFLLESKSSGNLLDAFYKNLPMGRKDTSFVVKLQYILVRRHELNYTDMFVENQI